MKRLSKYDLVRERVATYNIDTRASDPENIAEILIHNMRLTRKTQEHFIVFVLNAKLDILAVHDISTGTADNAPVHPRDVFQAVLSAPGGVGLIVAHNHISDDTTPSNADIETTKRLQDDAEILGYKLIDHIIVAGNSFLSMKTCGYM